MLCEELNPNLIIASTNHNTEDYSIKEIMEKREVFDFDLSRFCELEIIKSKWITLKGNLTDHDLIMNKICLLFEPYFKIEEVWFDDIGYLIFKISLTAIKKGQLHSFLELGILIEVLSVNEQISNEVKKNCLLFDRKNELQCRVGDHLTFYLSKNK
jgi:hypothetical protein